MIGVREHLAMAAPMPGLPRCVRPGSSLGRLVRSAAEARDGGSELLHQSRPSWRLSLIDLGPQRSDGRRQRHHQINDRLGITTDRGPQLLTPHDRENPCTITESCPPDDDPSQRLLRIRREASPRYARIGGCLMP